MRKTKLAIIVRKDLGMRTGKIAVQVGHASVMAYRECPYSLADRWIETGQKKIVLKANSDEELDRISDSVREIRSSDCEHYITVCDVVDFGLTQIDPNTRTCIAIGPDEDEIIDEITKGMSLL